MLPAPPLVWPYSGQREEGQAGQRDALAVTKGASQPIPQHQ
jgi:hypothetical protein